MMIKQYQVIGLALALLLSPMAMAQKHTKQQTAHARPASKPVPRDLDVDPIKTELTADGQLNLASAKAMIVRQSTGETLYAKNANAPTPIASLTKLMTAMVVLDAGLPMDDVIRINDADVDTLKGTGSRLRLGTELSRRELLEIALVASENRAASALGRSYPGGATAFIRAMNTKAKLLGMMDTRFADSTGLNTGNISTAEDLVKLVNAAYQYNDIRAVSTLATSDVPVRGLRDPLHYMNTNALVRKGEWVIGLSKTGYIKEAGRCLVMQAEISGEPLIIVLLDSQGKNSRLGDAQRIRKWLEQGNLLTAGLAKPRLHLSEFNSQH